MDLRLLVTPLVSSNFFRIGGKARVAQWVRLLDLTAHTSLSPIRRGFVPSFVNYKKGALDSQPQVIKFTSCLPMVGGSLWVIRLPPPLKLVAIIIAEILLKVALNTINSNSNSFRIGSVMVSVLASSKVDRGFEHR